MREIDIKESDRILIIAPHPDDESIGTGGLLSLFASQCDVWLLTDGRMGGINGSDPSAVAHIREEEFKEAMRKAGVNDYRTFKIKDRSLSVHTEILLKESFESYDKVFVTNSEDSHPDHAAAFIALTYAINNGAKYNSDVEIYQYEVTTPLSDVTHFIDFTGNLSNKEELIGCYLSQLEQADYYSISLCLNRFRAAVFNKRDHYIEAFKKTEYGDAYDSKLKELLILKRQQEKLECLLSCYDKWINTELSGKKITRGFEKKTKGSVWIYGCGLLGRTVYKVMIDAGMCVVGYLDKYVKSADDIDVDIYNPDDVKETERSYYVIVTAIFEFDQIKKELEWKGFNNIISFTSIVEGDYLS